MARMSSSQTMAVGRGPGEARTASAASRPARTSRGAVTVRREAPGTCRTASSSARARTAKVQVSTAEARCTIRRWPRPSRWSVTWRMPSAMARFTCAAAPWSPGSLSSITSGRPAAPQRPQCVRRHRGGDHPVQCRACRVERVPGGAGAVGGRVEDHSEVVLGGDGRGARVDPGEELVGERGDDEEGGAGAAQPETAGREVRPVAQLAGAAADPLGGRRRHPATPFVTQHERDRRLRDTRGPRHVTAGGPGWGGLPRAAHSCLRARPVTGCRGVVGSRRDGLPGCPHGTYERRRYT